jgi:hypothetical protein
MTGDFLPSHYHDRARNLSFSLIYAWKEECFVGGNRREKGFLRRKPTDKEQTKV